MSGVDLWKEAEKEADSWIWCPRSCRDTIKLQLRSRTVVDRIAKREKQDDQEDDKDHWIGRCGGVGLGGMARRCG